MKPGWVLSGASLDMNFAGGTYYPATVDSLLTTTRASTGYAATSSGLLVPFLSNIPRITDLGLLAEQAATNVVLWNRDLTNAAWTKSNITAALDQTGADGTANAATSLTATAGNGTCLQAITLASSARFQSAYVKRLTGTGTINMTLDNGATWTAIVVTAAYTKLTIPTQTLANPTVGFRIVTSGDAIAVDFVQNETGTFATSPIAATTVAVTRAADAITLTNGTFALPLSVYAKANIPTVGASGQVLIGWGSANPQRAHMASAGGTPQFSNDSAGFNISPTGTWTSGTTGRMAARNQSGSYAATFNGGAMATSALTGGPTTTKVTLGTDVDGSRWLNGYLLRVALFQNTALSNAQLQALP